MTIIEQPSGWHREGDRRFVTDELNVEQFKAEQDRLLEMLGLILKRELDLVRDGVQLRVAINEVPA